MSCDDTCKPLTFFLTSPDNCGGCDRKCESRLCVSGHCGGLEPHLNELISVFKIVLQLVFFYSNQLNHKEKFWGTSFVIVVWTFLTEISFKNKLFKKQSCSSLLFYYFFSFCIINLFHNNNNHTHIIVYVSRYTLLSHLINNNYWPIPPQNQWSLLNPSLLRRKPPKYPQKTLKPQKFQMNSSRLSRRSSQPVWVVMPCWFFGISRENETVMI